MSDRLSPAEVDEIAALARLRLAPEVRERLAAELEEILEHVAVLREVDVEGIEPMTHVAEMPLRLRPDDVGESLDLEAALQAAPAGEDGFFVVPSSISPER
jgi:aspartyl-tRNA(Asn)/glutamyl-tRNA(Gln) amidotransferase subunit C